MMTWCCLTSCCAAGRRGAKKWYDASGPSAPAKVRHRFQTKLRCEERAPWFQSGQCNAMSPLRHDGRTRCQHGTVVPSRARPVRGHPNPWQHPRDLEPPLLSLKRSGTQRSTKLPMCEPCAPRAERAAIGSRHTFCCEGTKVSTLRHTNESSRLTSPMSGRASGRSPLAKVRLDGLVGHRTLQLAKRRRADCISSFVRRADYADHQAQDVVFIEIPWIKKAFRLLCPCFWEVMVMFYPLQQRLDVVVCWCNYPLCFDAILRVQFPTRQTMRIRGRDRGILY